MSMYREWCTDQLAVAAGVYGARPADQLVGQLGFRTAPGECGVWGRLASWRREFGMARAWCKVCGLTGEPGPAMDGLSIFDKQG